AVLLSLAAASLLAIVLAAAIDAAHAQRSLAAPESFQTITDPAARSAAAFKEVSKVLMHPRCVNCHPAGNRPLQHESGQLHQPPAERGAEGLAPPAMRCPSCHQKPTFEPGRVPGHLRWQLAPREMAWQGKTPAEICAQIKDPARNGGRSLAQIHEHIGTDTL